MTRDSDLARLGLHALGDQCAEHGRDRSELRVTVALRALHLDDIVPLADLGVDELVIVDGPPEDPHAAADWVAALADHWLSAVP